MFDKKFSINIVVPAFNEQDAIVEFHSRLTNVLKKINQAYTIIYIDDGSTDETVTYIQQLQATDSHITLLQLSRNFGKEIAMTAGLDHADADVTIIIDSDLQDPPELIPDLITKWQQGYDVVYAKRAHRSGETRCKKLTAFLYYRILNALSHTHIPEDTGDFRLINRPALEALKQVRESNRYMKGIFSWIGFSQIGVIYNRDARFAGTTKLNYRKLWNLALEGVTSFTTKPLKLSSYIGFATATIAFFYGIVIILQKLLLGNPVPGYPSLMAVVLFMGGVQLMSVGIIGEYLARTFCESKGRPLYLIKQKYPTSTLNNYEES